MEVRDGASRTFSDAQGIVQATCEDLPHVAQGPIPICRNLINKLANNKLEIFIHTMQASGHPL